MNNIEPYLSPHEPQWALISKIWVLMSPDEPWWAKSESWWALITPIEPNASPEEAWWAKSEFRWARMKPVLISQMRNPVSSNEPGEPNLSPDDLPLSHIWVPMSPDEPNQESYGPYMTSDEVTYQEVTPFWICLEFPGKGGLRLNQGWR